MTYEICMASGQISNNTLRSPETLPNFSSFISTASSAVSAYFFEPSFRRLRVLHKFRRPPFEGVALRQQAFLSLRYEGVVAGGYPTILNLNAGGLSGLPQHTNHIFLIHRRPSDPKRHFVLPF